VAYHITSTVYRLLSKLIKIPAVPKTKRILKNHGLINGTHSSTA